MGDSEPCSQVHEGDLSICTYNCPQSAIPDTDIDLVRRIAVVTGRLGVVRTDLLDLRAFECLEEIGGNLLIFDNSKLETLSGLEQVRHIAQRESAHVDYWHNDIDISSNPRLRSLAGIEAAREITDIAILGNASLSSLSLNHVEHIGQLTLGACARNSSFDEAFGSGSNPSLTALDGFDSLVSLEKLSVAGQSNLTSIARLTELAQRGVQFTQVEIHVNERLERADIDAFMSASGATGTVCGNGGDDTPCPCPSGPEPCICEPVGG
jgi:hypothetical protein